MQGHQKESKRGYHEIQSRNHTRNGHGIKKCEKIKKNAETRPRQADYTPRQAG